MFSFVQNRIIVLFFVAFNLGLLSCSSQKEEKRVLSNGEILQYTLSDKEYIENINGSYLFICGPQCKGCTISFLNSLDSLLSFRYSCETKPIIISSCKFVESIPLKNVEIIFDNSWEKVNLDFYNVRFIQISDGKIIKENTLQSDNRNSFFNETKAYFIK
jgi:hypothetical protein